MKTRKANYFLTLLLLGLSMVGSMTSCAKSNGEETEAPREGRDEYEIPGVPPATPIDPEFVGTWYPVPTLNHPLSENWENKTFEGSEGFADYRTMVYTADGKNAIEYIANLAGGVGYFYKYVGNLVQEGSTLQFYPKYGFLRIHRNGAITTDRRMTQSDFTNSPSLNSVLTNCQVNTSGGVTTLTGRREMDVTYRKAGGGSGGGGNPTPGGVYSTPPTSGTYVKIGTQYYPTVTIGNKEWMAVNYVGPSPLEGGSVSGYGAVEDGKYYSWRDAEAVANPQNGLVPAGWRLPTKADFESLLTSQGIQLPFYEEYSVSTDDLEDGSAGALNLYKLLANNRWPARLDNGNTTVNATGFAAIPSDFKNTSDRPLRGYDANAYLWTSTSYGNNQAWNFQITRFTTSITAGLRPTNKGGSVLILYPFRLVKDK
ncbi:MAG TPA: FISUMP domain-containing protein [Flavisolibacter sp.]|nr:FISUMP domain-containing protein [Flavisolibacter sp.]